MRSTKKILLGVACALIAVILSGCAGTPFSNPYPYHGPLVGPDGQPVVEPHYEQAK